MSLSKNQRFGLIVFIILIIAAYLVTVEPWKKSSKDRSPTEEPDGKTKTGDSIFLK